MAAGHAQPNGIAAAPFLLYPHWAAAPIRGRKMQFQALSVSFEQLLGHGFAIQFEPELAWLEALRAQAKSLLLTADQFVTALQTLEPQTFSGLGRRYTGQSTKQ
jgi:hypothetical protein